MNLPNLLTTIRLVTVLPLLVLLNGSIDERFRYAMIIFCFSIFTDVLDGFLARKLKQATDLGVFYDAVVDKILIYTVLFSLYSFGVFKYYVIFPMFVRDIIVDSLRSFAARDGIVGANRCGKLKFLFQSISVILALLYLGFGQQERPSFSVLTNSCLAVAFLVSIGGLGEVLRHLRGIEDKSESVE